MVQYQQSMLLSLVVEEVVVGMVVAVGQEDTELVLQHYQMLHIPSLLAPEAVQQQVILLAQMQQKVDHHHLIV